MSLRYLFNKISLLWKDTTKTGEGVAEFAEPSEARFRTWVLLIAMLVGPPLLLLIYFKTMVPGLMNNDALDYAQLGRNLQAGRGFVTFILRPLALTATHGNNPFAQPDMTHGPLFPFLLALAFGLGIARDNQDAVPPLVSGIFYLLTIPVLYVLAVRLFNRAVGLLAALTVTFNAHLLEYAGVGLPITCYVFLMTCLLLVVYNIATAAQDSKGKFPRGQYILAGLLMGLLYLTEPLFFWVVPFLIIGLYVITPQRRLEGLLAFLLPMGVLMLPWMARNVALDGNAVFGLRGMEILMYTKDHYPGLKAYQMLPADVIPGVEVYEAIVRKILLGAGEIIKRFPEITASWLLAFFLPCLLFRFSDPAANILRRIMLLCMLGVFMGMLAFTVNMPIFVAVIPTMLVYSVAYLLHLTQQAKLRAPSMALVSLLLVVAIGFPLLSDMVLSEKPLPIADKEAAKQLAQILRPDEIALSDQPWVVAWYADRPSIWIPADGNRLPEIRSRFPTIQALFLTESTPFNPDITPDWRTLYRGLAKWDEGYLLATARNQPYKSVKIHGTAPLAVALEGFESVPPAKGSSLGVVVAAKPVSERKLGMRVGAGNPVR